MRTRSVALMLTALALGCSNSAPKGDPVLEPPPAPPNRPSTVCDSIANDTAEDAQPVGQAGHFDGLLCTNDEDWYRVEVTGPLTIRLIPAGINEDLILEVQSDEGESLGSETGGVAVLPAEGPVNVRVYSTAAHTRITYRLTVGPSDGVLPSDDPDDPVSDPTDPDEPANPPNPPVDFPAECDAEGANATQESAAALNVPTSTTAQMCTADEDWFAIDSTEYVRVTIAFDNTLGDLDLKAIASDGTELASSTSLEAEEVIEAQGPFAVHVFSYSVAEGTTVPYTITTAAIEPPSEPDPALCDASGEDDSIATAPRLSGSAPRAGMVCTGDDDYIEFDEAGHFTVTLSFTHADGDLDLALVSADGTALDTSTGTEDTEIADAEGPFFIHVYAYGDANAEYTLTVTPGAPPETP